MLPDLVTITESGQILSLDSLQILPDLVAKSLNLVTLSTEGPVLSGECIDRRTLLSESMIPLVGDSLIQEDTEGDQSQVEEEAKTS